MSCLDSFEKFDRPATYPQHRLDASIVRPHRCNSTPLDHRQ